MRLVNSIIKKINSELERKFSTSWNPSYTLSESALVSYSHLKKDVKFYYNLDDNFYNQPFNGGSVVNVDYFGVKEGDPNSSRTDLLIYDFKSPDDFIIQIKCRDSLDEVYFAKTPMESTLLASYQKVIERVNLDNMELFNGGDILQIPYIKFDTTTNYTDIEGTYLTNEIVEGKEFQSVSQRISFDLNQQGIKLESSAESIIEFADFDNPPPRVLAFDKPFLIIMKRKNSHLPYFMYLVSGVEFMRSYILKSRTIEENEIVLLGKWKLKNSSIEVSILFKPDGCYEIIRRGGNNSTGTWSYTNNVIHLNKLISSNSIQEGTEWILDEISEQEFVIGGKTKGVFVKE